MKPRFYLKEPKKDGETSIFCKAYADGRPVKIPVGYSIHPRDWDKEKERAKGGRFRAAINERIASLFAQLLKEYTQLRYEGKVPTPDLFRERLRAKPDADAPTPGVIETYTLFIEERPYGSGTLRNHRSSKGLLKSFATAYGLSLEWGAIGIPFLEKFARYLQTVKGQTNDTTWSHIKSFRAVLAWAEERGIPVNPEYAKFTRRRIPKGERSSKVYLSPEEQRRLADLDLSDDDRLRRVRDLFLFLCNTGLRFGDAQRLRPEHRRGNEFVLVTEKTKKLIRVPALPVANRIWKMYEQRLPQISNQKFNVYLHELCQLAGIDEPTTVVDYRGSKRTEKTVPKYKLIGAHTAKRSFITNLLLAGVSIPSVCEITGNTLKTIQTYIVPTSEDVHKEILSKM